MANEAQEIVNTGVSAHAEIASASAPKPSLRPEEVRSRIQVILKEPVNTEPASICTQVESVIKSREELKRLARLGAELADSVKACRPLRQLLESRFRQLAANLESLEDEPAKITASLEELARGIKAIVLAKHRISERFDFDSFNEVPLDTPRGLGDRKADVLTEEILEIYGHENYGKTLAQRRRVSGSTWKAGFVPDSVRKLVSVRRTASDNLTGEDARKILVVVRADMQEQMVLESSSALSAYLSASSAPMAEGIVDAWQKEKHDSPSSSIAEIQTLTRQLPNARRFSEDASRLKSALLQAGEEVLAVIAPIEIDLEGRQARQRVLVNNERALSFLRSPDTLLQQVALETKPNELGAMASEFGSDNEKNDFVRVLANRPSLDHSLEQAFSAFISAEAIRLVKRLRESAGTTVDDCIATLPRLLLGTELLGQQTRQKIFGTIMDTPGIPAWIAGWYEFRRPDFSNKETMKTLQVGELAREIAAYGRLEGFDVPLSPALKLDGGHERRALTQESAAILDKVQRADRF